MSIPADAFNEIFDELFMLMSELLFRLIPDLVREISFSLTSLILISEFCSSRTIWLPFQLKLIIFDSLDQTQFSYYYLKRLPYNYLNFHEVYKVYCH